MNQLNELHPMGEGKMAFETAVGQVFLEASDESMTPFGGFVPLAAFFEKLGLLDSIAARCPAVRTSPNASAVRDVLTSFILSCLCDGSRFNHINLNSAVGRHIEMLSAVFGGAFACMFFNCGAVRLSHARTL